ncbi:17504_t:CDS:1, partial [Racocetra persica]
MDLSQTFNDAFQIDLNNALALDSHEETFQQYFLDIILDVDQYFDNSIFL